MRTAFMGILLGFAVSSSAAVSAQPNCFQISLFTVDTENVDTKEEARAAAIPEHRLLQIQQAIVQELKADFSAAKVVMTESEKCPENTESLLVGGKITDFKKGNKALRYLVGFGAGAQKVQVLVGLNSGDGKLVAEEDIVDRKFAGLLGGSENKGIEDFAEKVVAFIKKSIGSK